MLNSGLASGPGRPAPNEFIFRGGGSPGKQTLMRITSRHSARIPLRRLCTSGRRGFTLAESLCAAAILGVIVLAVTTAISTAQRTSFEGQKRILAAIAADDRMVELATLSYEELLAKNGLDEPPGEMTTLDDDPYPESFWAIGRRTSVVEETVVDKDTGVEITGLRVIVTTRDEWADLAVIEMFVPEPAS